MADQITPAQIRAARAMLDWSMVDLAQAARVSVLTVKRAEMTEPQPVSNEVRCNIQNAFETSGVHFLSDDGNGPGLRLPRSE